MFYVRNMFFSGCGRNYPLTPSKDCTLLSSIVIPPDLRSYPMPAYLWEMLEDRMRVDARVRQTVVFIGAENERGFMPYGTAVIGFASYEDMGNTVLITAQHVIEDIPGDYVSVRVNRKDGGADTRKIKKSGAVTFTDRAIDLAVLPESLDPTIHEIWAVPLSSSAWEEQLKTHGEPEPGDEVCVVGLYTTHFGHVRNLPVARIGHLAALPEEKVMTDRGYVSGYLIECQSIAGLSGSPVFWANPRFKVEEGNVLRQISYVPLGILIGYHVVESAQDELIVPKFQQEPETRLPEALKPKSEERRTGFAVVLPINHIFRMFESEPMQKIMKDGVEYARKASGYRRASCVPLEIDPPATDANPTHREDFTRLVGAAARKREQED
jgi:hypothetical protein